MTADHSLFDATLLALLSPQQLRCHRTGSIACALAGLDQGEFTEDD
jgi:hypothetical protein